MDLASYYQELFIHSCSQPTIPFTTNASDYDTCSPGVSPSSEDTLSPNPCWDLESILQDDLYQFDDTSSVQKLPNNMSTDHKQSQAKNNSSATTKASGEQGPKRQRTAANARERKRMNRINEGYGRLKRLLPGQTAARELSKMEALQVAHAYILQLAAALHHSQ